MSRVEIFSEINKRASPFIRDLRVLGLIDLTVTVVKFHNLLYSNLRLASIAGAVIQAIGRPEFEDGLWTGVHLEDSWCPSRVRTNPVVKMAPCLTLGAHPGRC